MNPSNSNPEECDLLVLGSGAGGKLISWTYGGKGQRVVTIERKYVGGACPNIACLPSKNLIHSAKVASYFFRSEEFGISKDNVRINMSAVRERKRKMVQRLLDIHLDNYRKSGTEVTVIDRNSRLTHLEDEDISQALGELCRDEGINVVTNVKVDQVEGRS